MTFRRFTKKGLPAWPMNSDQRDYVKKRVAQNLVNSLKNEAENAFFAKLELTELSWKRQYPYGFRIFDFFNKDFGVAIELDGREHCQAEAISADNTRDMYAFYRSGIIVLRFPNGSDFEPKLIAQKVTSFGAHKQRKSLKTLIAADYGLSFPLDFILFKHVKPHEGQPTRKCKSCGIKFATTRGQRYCTPICKANYLRSGKKQIPSIQGMY